MRCPSCEKFTSMDEPQCEWDSGPDLEVTDDGAENGEASFGLTGSIRITRSCADCGTELKEATLDMEETITLTLPEGVSADDVELDADDPEGSESGGGRYKKNMIGADVSYRLNANGTTIHEANWHDEIAAGQMDECC